MLHADGNRGENSTYNFLGRSIYFMSLWQPAQTKAEDGRRERRAAAMVAFSPRHAGG